MMKDVGNLLVFIAHILKAIFTMNKIHSLIGGHVK